MTFENPVFVTYAIAAAIMLVKMMGQGWITVYRMMTLGGGFLNPEDAAKGWTNPNPRDGQLAPHPEVERSRRMHHNDLENIPAFLVAGFLLVLTHPPLWVAQLLLYGFVAARIGHFWAYFTAKSHETRATFFSIGSLIIIGIASYTLIFAFTKGSPMITNSQSNTSIIEIADGIYRISTPVPPNPVLPAGFTFNQFLIVDDEPLLFHTGLRKMFPLVREAIAAVMPVERLRYLALSHYESDECGALNDFLALAPQAQPLCSMIEKVVSVDDAADREARGMADGEVLSIGQRSLRWLDTPHLPHGWGCGYLFEQTSRTLFCGDMFTQPGHQHEAVTESDILGPSEAMRGAMDYYAHSTNTADLIAKLAGTEPELLACMHGASFRGNGAALFSDLSSVLAR